MSTSDPQVTDESPDGVVRVVEVLPAKAGAEDSPSVRRGRLLFLVVVVPIILVNAVHLLAETVSGDMNALILLRFLMVAGLAYAAWRGESWAWMLLILAFSLSAALSLWPDVSRSKFDVFLGVCCGLLAIVLLLSRSVHDFLRFQEDQRRVFATVQRYLRR